MTYDRLAELLKEASEKHHEYEEKVTTGKPDANWPLWYAVYILTKYSTEFDSEGVGEEQIMDSVLANVVGL